MISADEKPSTELVPLPPQDRARAVLAFDATKAKLAEVAGKYLDITEVTNKAGRDQAHAAAMELRDLRIEVQKRAKSAREDATAFSKAVIAAEGELVGVIEPEEDRLKQLRDAWDDAREAEKRAIAEADQRRIAAIRERIAGIRALVTQYGVATTLELLDEGIAKAEAAQVTREVFEELTVPAEEAKAAVLETLRGLRDAAVARRAEAERLEAARIALEADRARLAAEREENERIARAERERAEAERARLDAEAQAERDRAAAEAKAERDRAAAELAAREEEAAAERKRKDDIARAEREAQAAAELQQRETEEAERRERQRAEDEQRADELAELNHQRAAVEAERQRQAQEQEAREQAERDAAAAQAAKEFDEQRQREAAEFEERCQNATLREAAEFALQAMQDEIPGNPATTLLDRVLARCDS